MTSLAGQSTAQTRPAESPILFKIDEEALLNLGPWELAEITTALTTQLSVTTSNISRMRRSAVQKLYISGVQPIYIAARLGVTVGRVSQLLAAARLDALKATA